MRCILTVSLIQDIITEHCLQSSSDSSIFIAVGNSGQVTEQPKKEDP